MPLNFENLNSWKHDHEVVNNGSRWRARVSGSIVFVNNFYPEFSSGKYLASLLGFLIKKSSYDQFSVRSVDHNGDIKKTWAARELTAWAEYFDSNANWGEWFFVPGSVNDIPEDLLKLLHGVSSVSFALYLDLDSGLIAVIGANLAKQL